MADVKNPRKNSLKGELEGLFKGDLTVIVEDTQGIVVGLDKMLGNQSALKSRVVAS